MFYLWVAAVALQLTGFLSDQRAPIPLISCILCVHLGICQHPTVQRSRRRDLQNSENQKLHQQGDQAREFVAGIEVSCSIQPAIITPLDERVRLSNTQSPSRYRPIPLQRLKRVKPLFFKVVFDNAHSGPLPRSPKLRAHAGRPHYR